MRSDGRSTRWMPFPPPPPAALISTGNVRFFAAFIASASLRRSVPDSTGTPAARTARRVLDLSPHRARAAAGGPMKVRPACAQASAKAGFSDRNP